MTPRKRLLFILALLIVTIVCYYVGKSALEKQHQTQDEPQLDQQKSDSAGSPTSRAGELRNRTPSPEKNLDTRVARYTDGSVDLVDAVALSQQLHQSRDPRNDLEVVAQLFVQYRLLFERNPVGTENFEFTAALTGDNTKKVNFIDPESPALAPTNELVDRWDNPFVFHPLSGKEIEIISLGPDQTLWTEDDLTLDNSAPF